MSALPEHPRSSTLGWALPEPTPGWMPVPAWVSFPWLRAGFSVRQGGVSQVYGPDEQNLSWTAEDDAARVAANRGAYLAAVARGAAMELVTLQQIHGCVVRDIDAETGPLMSASGRAVLQGDGLITQTPGRMLGMVTADCVPVLVADTRLRAVGAFHAGWRGTVARIAEHGIAMMRARYGSHSQDLVAAIGPSIGPCCFLVGDEVRAQFVAEFPYGEALVSTSAGGLHLDLAEANRRQLLTAGVPTENVQLLAECTACTRTADGARKYFSHRAEQGFTGRMLSVVGVAPE